MVRSTLRARLCAVRPQLARKPVYLAVLGLVAAGSMVAAHDAMARITKIEIASTSTAFGGYGWPGVGQYDRIVGKAYGEVDPADPKNALIVDIGLASRVNGKVQYSFDFYILKPRT